MAEHVSWRDRLREYTLTAGELGSSAGQTIMVVLLPVLLERYQTSAMLIGVVIGGEGVLTLLVPLVVGAFSDHLHPRLAGPFGRRGFFLMLTAPVMAATLALAPFLHGFWTLGLIAFLFFTGVNGYYTPLWTLMIDAVPPERRGRVQGARGVLRAAGLAFGLVASGILYSGWEPLPFLVAALLVLVTTAMTMLAAKSAPEGPPPPHSFHPMRLWHDLSSRPGARRFLLANALWSGAVDGIRPYFFLFASAVIGLSVAQTSMGLSILVASIGVGAAVVGRLGDRYGPGPVLRTALAGLTFAMMCGFFLRSPAPTLGLLVVAGLAAAAVVTLPYPLFANMMEGRNMGQNTGLFVLSVSAGRMLAPVLVGGIIDLGERLEPATRGYPFMWVAAALFAGGAWLVLGSSLRHQERGQAKLREPPPRPVSGGRP